MNNMNTTETKANEAKAMAIGMSREILANSRDINNILSVSGIVPPSKQTHYVNTENEESGIEALITRILRENEAIFPANVGETQLRHIAIAGAMFTDEILAKVQEYFSAGSTRYPLQTVKNYLSTYMFKQGKVGKIQLKGFEDKSRECPKPRCVWFLAQ